MKRIIQYSLFSIRRISKKLLLGLVTLLIIGGPLLYLFLINASESQAVWYDDSWTYRQRIDTTVGASSSSDIANLPTLISFSTSTLISNSKLQTSCADLRFTNANGKLLPYYIDSGCNSSTTKVWVLLDTVPKNTTTYTMYMYYGNNRASAGSDSTQFRLFNGLVGYWTMNETSGSSVVDSSITAGTAGTATGTTIVDGQTGFSKARSFPGTINNFVQIPNNSSLNPTSQITVAFWAYQAAAQSDKQIIIKNMTSGNGGWRLTATGTGAYHFQIPVTNFSHGITSGSYSTSAWHHVVGTYDGAKMRLYVDGVLANSLDRTGNILSDVTTDLFLGRYTSDVAQFNGYVDDTRIYNRAISADEVAQLYTNTGTIAGTATTTIKPTTAFASEENTPGPVAYWTLGDASGVVAKNSTWKKTNTQTTNLITNPSFETNLTSWGFAGAGISHAQSSEQAMFGTYSDKITWSSNAAHYEEYVQSVSGSTTYSLTMYVYSSSTSACFNYWEWNGSSGTAQNTVCPTVTNTWQKLTMTVTTQSSTVALLVRFYPNDSTSSGTAYFDGVQVEQASSATNYCDGSLTTQGGHRWTGTAHASTSVCDNGTDGFILNGSWQAADQCIAGGCQKFNGTSTVIQNVTSVSGVKTVSMWVRPTSVSSSALIDLNGTARVTVSSGTISATGFTSPTIYVNGVVSSTLVANQWQHVAVTTGTGITASSVKIGNYSTTYFNGFIDEVKFYAEARTAAQVKTDYSSKGSVKGTSAVIASDPRSNLANGLVGYWKMDESSGNRSDSSGNGNTLTDNATVTSNPGKFGNAGQFTRTNTEYLSITDNASLSTGDIDFTFSAWVYADTTGGAGVFNNVASKDGNTNQREWVLYTGSANPVLRFAVSPDGTSSSNGIAISTTTLSTGTWYFVVAWHDSINNTVNIQVNNGAVDSTSYSSGTADRTGDFQIGASIGGQAWDGRIDEARFYKRVLSPVERTALYNFAPGPVGYWNMDENNGSSAYDKSGSANTGVITGALWKSGKYGSGLDFDGSDDVVTVTNASAIDLNTHLTGHTYEAWVYADSDGEGDLGQVYQKGTTTYLRVSGQSGSSLNIDASLDLATTDATVSISAPITTGTWNHVAVVYEDDSDDEIQVYVNGVLRGTSTDGVGSLAAESSNLLIGGTTTANFDGKIDDFRFYGYGRTSKQIVEDMNAGHPSVGSPVGSAVGHWKFDEGADNTCSGGTNDTCNSGSGGSTHDGAKTGATWTNSGKFGKALSFDGTDDDVNVGDPSNGAFDFGLSDSFTLTAWIKTSGPTGISDAQCIICKDVGSLQKSWWFRTSNTNVLQFLISDGTNEIPVNGATTVTTGQWIHVAAIRDVTSDTLKVYVNGTQDGSVTDTTTSGTENANPVKIGEFNAAPATRQFNGTIDEPKIYRYALTADEVKIDMNRSSSQVLGSLSDKSTPGSNFAAGQEYCIPGDSSSCAAPVGEWKFDEKQGSSARDTSGNAFTGTLTSSPTWTQGKIGSGVAVSSTNSSYITMGNINKTMYTLSFWFKPNSTVDASNAGGLNNLVVFIDGSGHNADVWLQGGPSTGACTDEVMTLISTLANTRTCSSSITSISPTWNHLVLVWNSTASRYDMYLNGQLQTVTPGTATHVGLTTISALKIAQRGATPEFADSWGDFAIDQLRIYDYARSAAQIAWDYNRGAPVGHWKFDECQGTTAYDDSRNANGTTNGNNGTITVGGAPNTAVGTCTGSANTMWKDGATGKYNSSLDFDGTDDYITIADTANLRFDESTKDFSLFAWVKRTTTGTEYIVSKEDADNDGYRLIFNSSNQVQCSEDATDVTSTSTITDTNWHLVGCTIDRDGNGQTYIDGRSDGSTAAMGTDAMATTSAITIGTRSYTSTSYFNGQIDDVQIYNYALTATQVKTLYNQGAVRFGPSSGTP